MVGDVTKGEYHLKIRDSLVTADDNVYECQVTSYELRSRQANLTVLGEKNWLRHKKFNEKSPDTHPKF